MIKVDNKKTIKQVADVSFRADKTRNFFAIIAIILTTVLFSSLFTVAGSLMTSMEESIMRQVGGNAHGGFKYLTMEQYEKIKAHPSIKEISYSVVLATAENAELAKRPTEIRYANDELEAEMMFSMPTTGRLPEAADELATDTLVLERLGVPAKLGEEVTLAYSVCGEKYEKTFKLVGFWQGDIIMNASQVWLSREYVESILSRYDLTNAPDYVGAVNADVNFSNSWGIEEKLIKVITDSGYRADEIATGVNWAYVGGSLSVSVEMVLGVTAVICMIIFCGYLMISNVFLISVTKDVRFYGLLKTIGTTGKQIKVLMKRQALLLCAVGIPLGMLFGCLIGGFLTPIVLSILNTNIVRVSLHLWVFIFAGIFSFLTVFISIRKASKIAAKVSPMEALRTSDGTQNIRKDKKRSGKISLYRMAVGNIGRNRKKAVLVTVSLSLSLIVLNGAYTMANGFDMDKYLDSMISHDFVMGDVSWFNVHANYLNQDTLSDEFIEKIYAHDGVESLERVFFAEEQRALDQHWEDMAVRANQELGLSGDWLKTMQEEIANGRAMYHSYGIDDAIWEDFTVWEGEIDLEKLYSGKYVVASPYDTEGRLSAYQVGDKVNVPGKDGKSRECEIIAIASMPYNISIQHSHPVDINFFMPSDVFLNEVAQKEPMILTLDMEDSQIDVMEKFLADYCENENINMQYESKASYMAEYENTQRTYKVVGIVISSLLALIGIANFANTSITSIMARKRELAMLESIGMTIRQQRKMLVSEGMVYTILTAGFTWTVGILMGKYGLMLAMAGSDYYTLNFTVIPSVVCLPVLLLLSVMIPILCQHYVNSKSVVDRLRELE